MDIHDSSSSIQLFIHRVPHARLVFPMKLRPVVLLVLDGWGVSSPSRANAITSAATPNIDSYIREYPALTLQASGEAVGLPWGEPGNSEVGHLALGSGRIVYQDFPLITKSIQDESFYTNTALVGAITHAKNAHGALHLIGLVSSGGVHSYHEHLFALLELCQRESIEHVYVHVILDGRDTPYNSGLGFVEKLEQKMRELGVGAIASVSGRFWAMDRDHHWDRTEKAYRAMVIGDAPKIAPSAAAAIQQSYNEAVFDEELVPTVIGIDGQPMARLHDNDAIVFFNFRPDRMRQIASAVSLEQFVAFDRGVLPSNVYVATMTEYDDDLPVHVAFPKDRVRSPIAKMISDAGLKQLHVAETEKYAHVTYFFNGGFEAPFPGEDHVLIPSRKVVSHADAPEMAAKEIAATVVKAVLSETYDFIVANFANADMVAHTGNEEATIRAVQELDVRVGEIADAVLAKNGLLVITADHGNAEVLLNMQSGEIDKEHNTSPVPCVMIANQLHGKTAGGHDAVSGDLSLLTPAGVLADVAPTILKFLDIPPAEEMTGRSLL